MNRVRNADEFLLRLRQIKGEYENIFAPELERIRKQYASRPEVEKRVIEDYLEIHARTYFVNAFLAALNWRMDWQPTDDLPNLIPEVFVRSEERKSIRFLDYLGFERSPKDEGYRPLLIVETKRPGAGLPLALTPAATYSEIISRGLRGERLGNEWNEWLNTLRDYVRSVKARSAHYPKRVVITNGDWLILFLDPRDAFLNGGHADPTQILVFKNREDIEKRFTEVFQHLEHQRVLGEVGALTPGDLPFQVDGREVDRALHGLHLRYIEQPGIYQPAPVVKLAPVVFLRTRYGAWLRVETPPQEYTLPHRYEDLPNHLNEVDQAALRLLNNVNRQLGTSLTASPLTEHYDNEDDFAGLPGVQEQDSDRFILVTGDKTHYILPKPSVTNCPYHEWQACRRNGVSSDSSPIVARSVNPRSFFISGELHHCAHRDVNRAKSSQITPDNRARCGLRSGQDGQAFCEIWRFEQYLCCRSCAFEEVCTKAEIFRLPCQRTVVTMRS